MTDFRARFLGATSPVCQDDTGSGVPATGTHARLCSTSTELFVNFLFRGLGDSVFVFTFPRLRLAAPVFASG